MDESSRGKRQGIAYGSARERPAEVIAEERCETLARLAESVGRPAEFDIAFQATVDEVAKRFGADEVYLHRLRRDGTFVLHAFHAKSLLADVAGRTFDSSLGRVSNLLSRSTPIFTDYGNPDSNDSVPAKVYELGYRGSVSIPLSTMGEFYGMISLVYRRDCPWGQDDEVFLGQVGRVLAAGARRLYWAEKNAEMQVINERKLVAAEVHDTAAQLASSISITADTVQTALTLGYDDVVKSGVSRIGDIARQLNKSLRDELLSLRVPLDESDGLENGVVQGLKRLKTQWGIDGSFEHDDSINHLSINTEIQLIRILTECFANVAKHAKAEHVTVELREQDQSITLTVSDDGCGFDVESVPDDRLGLKLMRERASLAGGMLNVESTPKGTIVTVVVGRT